MSLLDAKPIYKPFAYPWAYEAWLTQQRIHWLPEEVPLADDVKDWRNKLTESERHLLTQIFRFFTQADVEVNNCYMKQYSQVFKPTEVLAPMTIVGRTGRATPYAVLEPVEIIQLFYVQGTRIRAVSITETKPIGPNETVGPQRKLFDLVQRQAMLSGEARLASVLSVGAVLTAELKRGNIIVDLGSSVDSVLPEDLPLWKDIAADADTCLGTECPRYSECFVTRMRQRAADGRDIAHAHVRQRPQRARDHRRVLTNLRRAFERYPSTGPFGRYNVIFFAAWMSHYVSDANQPLHGVVNYNGQLTGQTGIARPGEAHIDDARILRDGVFDTLENGECRGLGSRAGSTESANGENARRRRSGCSRAEDFSNYRSLALSRD